VKKSIFAGVGVGLLLLLTVLALGCSSNQAELDKLKADNQKLTADTQKLTDANQQLKAMAGPPPASLDQFYPPKSPAPVYLVEMFNLAGPMDGIGGNLQGGNMAGVKASYTAFAAQYDKTSKMVPEWSGLFPKGPVDALGAAIDSGDPSKIGPAMGQVGQVCGDCHLLNQGKVMQKYHFRDFREVKVTDPVTKKELEFGDYMEAMVGTFGGALGALQGGKQADAVGAWGAFTSQYQALAQNACKQCHSDPVTQKEIPRKYFVDADSMAMIDQMGKALAAKPPDAKAAGDLSGAIGNAICFNCHLVHLPAQQAKDRWEKYADLFK
jgi:hypothetical protein